MSEINVLSQETISRIAAGEVVERPVNAAKELIENAIDAGSGAISVEIRNGGIDSIRVTDNGCGIEPSQIRKAFMRHATSKIKNEDDLLTLTSLGFRGEALSSIAAVAQVEMITKVRDKISGIRATNEVFGGAGVGTDSEIPLDISEVGAPDGTTVIVRNLFYNIPVRRRFLKTAQTEAGYITDLVERMALSHPEISFHYRVNGQEKLHTTGNGNLKELIYRIYGRDIASSVIPVDVSKDDMRLRGYLGRPEYSRASRSHEIFFVNGRMLRSDTLSTALEGGYRTDLMQHRFPFAVLYIDLPPAMTDVNVHPSKMEVRFSDAQMVRDFIDEAVHNTLHRVELIPKADLDTAAEEKKEQQLREKEAGEALREEGHLEAFETGRKKAPETVPEKAPESEKQDPVPESTAAEPAGAHPAVNYDPIPETTVIFEDRRQTDTPAVKSSAGSPVVKDSAFSPVVKSSDVCYEQASFIDDGFFSSGGDQSEEDLHYHILTPENAKRFTIVGQLFDTYWIVQFEDKMLMIDQHAAHEKVNFERLMARLENERAQDTPSQVLAPPIIVNLTGKEEAAFRQFESVFTRMGYEIEEFGGGAFAMRAVPLELYANRPDSLFCEVLDEILEEKVGGTPAAILYKIASMSCKAAIKGNSRITLQEAQALIDELLALDNPYHCPHGRPTMIVMSKTEIEKKFKRIV